MAADWLERALEKHMKAWKWTALVMSGGLLLQFGACAADIAYYLLQAAATQLITGALATAAGAV